MPLEFQVAAFIFIFDKIHFLIYLIYIISPFFSFYDFTVGFLWVYTHCACVDSSSVAVDLWFSEHVVCEDEFKYALLANNCLYPGLSTLSPYSFTRPTGSKYLSSHPGLVSHPRLSICCQSLFICWWNWTVCQSSFTCWWSWTVFST